MPRGGRRQRLDGPIQGNHQRCFQEIARRVHSLTRSLIPFFYNRQAHFILASVVEGHSVPLVVVSPTIPRSVIDTMRFDGNSFY
jgi:hypothetical protein